MAAPVAPLEDTHAKEVHSHIEDPAIAHLYRLLIVEGRNVYLSGAGGVGKSHATRGLIGILKKTSQYKVGLTSTTGVSAYNISGMTYHSWTGIKKGVGTREELLQLASSGKARSRWLNGHILVIDEVSMMGANMLDTLDYIGKKIRQPEIPLEEALPFGGLQILFSGDMLQLPPINDRYVFRSQVWDRLNLSFIRLNTPYRFHDLQFYHMLMRIRLGLREAKDMAVLEQRKMAYQKYLALLEAADRKEQQELKESLAKGEPYTPGKRIKPTVLFSTNLDTDAMNGQELKKLPGEPVGYRSLDLIHYKGSSRDQRLEDFTPVLDKIINSYVYLKPGAQVMLRVNLDVNIGLVNGARGVVLSCEKERVNVLFRGEQVVTIGLNTWEMETDSVKVKRTQIPLILAWATTIHKCVSENTYIYTEHGMKMIKDLLPSASEGWNNYTRKVATTSSLHLAAQVYKGKVEETIKLTTRSGYELEGTKEHRVMIMTEQGTFVWRQMGDLKLTDSVVLKLGTGVGSKGSMPTTDFRPPENYRTEYKIPTLVEEELSYLIGALIGDGSYRDASNDYFIEFAGTNRALLDVFKTKFKTVFDWDLQTYMNGNTPVKLYTNSKLIRKFLEWCGLDYVKAGNKKIPWVILANTLSCQAQCLKGLYDTDGGVNNGINYTTTSETLGIQVQLLLLNLGIVSNRYLMRGRVGNWNPVWRIDIFGIYAKLYMELISFNTPHKKEAGQKFLNRAIVKSNIGRIPGGQQLVTDFKKDLLAKSGATSRCNSLSKKGIGSIISRTRMGRSQLRTIYLPKFIEAFPDLYNYGPAGKTLYNMARNNLFPEPIESLQLGKVQVYDLSVPGKLNYVANGIISHNCQGSTLDSAIIDLGLSVFSSNMAYVALSRCRDLESMYLSNFHPNSIKAHPEALEFEMEMEKRTDTVILDFE